MRGKLISLLFFTLFFCAKAFGATFVVTSNADSGPGTLRDALTQAAAADSTITNYIYFNIADISAMGRTITLLSQLPDVSSNVVIDGTTQPGTPFGVSDARVALFFQTPVDLAVHGLSVVNKHDVAIYGLYIKLLTDITQSNVQYFWSGIWLRNDKNVTIGAAGKGNVVNGFYYPLVINFPVNELEYLENLTLKDNIFGLDADGETLSVNQVASVSLGQIVGNINLGGTVAEGNVFAQGLTISQENSVDYTDPSDYYASAPAYIQIQNNKIGVDYSVQNAITGSSGIYLSTVDPGGKNNCTIADNVITSSQMAIFVVNNALPLYILRNYIGTDRTLTKRFKTGGILINTVTSAAIGSADPADANFITNCNPVSIGPFSNVTVNKNSFFCTLYAQPMHGGNNSFNFEFIFPAINILKISPSAISGTATPNSSVELFYSDICKTCSPQTYFGSTTTDANGNWNYNGPITGTVIASATLGKNTSDFSQTAVIVDSVKVINGCSANGLGSITGAIPTSAASMQWVDAQGNVVGTSADLLNVKPGKYKLVVHNGDCSDSTSYFEIKNKFQLDTSGVKKVQPSCGDASGSITGLQIANYDTQPPTFAWTDAGGKVWSNAPDLQNAPAGRYSLLIETTDKSCSQIYGPVTLNNLTGVTVDQSQVAIKPTNCSKPVGSVTNLTVTGTGTIKYIWTNAQQQQVATTKDLTGQIPGIYTVQISDDSKCNPVTLTFTIPNSSQLAIDANGIKTIAATCGDANGSISGLKVTGAAKYSWTNSSGQIVGNNVDLSNINGGDYQLTATDDCGNTLQSSVFHIDQGNKAVFPNYAVSITDVCPGSSYGSINVSTDATVKSARWVDGQGNTVGNNIELANVSPGSYQLYLTDQNGCEAFYNKYTINQIPVLQLSTAQVNDDQCSTSVGRITGVNATGGKPPYNYSWSDGAGKVIANSNDITGLPAGEYTLTVTDASSCNPISSQYTIRNQQNDISPPSVDNLQLCSPGNALLTVNNPVAGYSYRLYESENSNAPITESTDGKLTFDVKANTTVYISRLKGSCESARTAVKITVGISGLNIPNTITPNGDGVNDYWVIPGMDNYPNALVQIFTRYGQQVFEARGYAHPFDGTSNGQPLPVGVYYYIINLNSNCNLLTGNLTILR